MQLIPTEHFKLRSPPKLYFRSRIKRFASPSGIQDTMSNMAAGRLETP